MHTPLQVLGIRNTTKINHFLQTSKIRIHMLSRHKRTFLEESDFLLAKDHSNNFKEWSTRKKVSHWMWSKTKGQNYLRIFSCIYLKCSPSFLYSGTSLWDAFRSGLQFHFIKLIQIHLTNSFRALSSKQSSKLVIYLLTCFSFQTSTFMMSPTHN